MFAKLRRRFKQNWKCCFERVANSGKRFFPFAFARIIPASLNLVAVPVVLRNSGIQIYGMITVLLALLSFQVLIDLGLTNSFLPVYIKMLNNNELEKAKKIYSSTIIRLLFNSSLLCVLSIPLVIFFNWGLSFDNPEGMNGQFRVAIYIVLISNVLGVLVGFTNRILLVFDRGQVSSILNSLSNSSVSLLMIVCSFLEAPIVPMTLGIVFTPILISLLTLIWITKKYDLGNLRSFSWKVSNFGFGNQLGNWTVQLSAILSVQFDAIILAFYNDSSEVARYGVISKVILFVVSIYVWSTSHETVDSIRLRFQGKIEMAHKEFIKSMQSLSIYTLIFSIPATLLLKPALKILSGGKFTFTHLEISIAILWCFTLVLATKMSRILYAENIFNGYFQVSVFVSCVNVVTTFWFSSRGLGIIGPQLGTIISTLCFFLPGFFYLKRQASVD